MASRKSEPRRSTLELLRADLDQLERQLAELVAISPVHWFDRRLGMFTVVTGPDYRFDKPCANQTRLQLLLKAAYHAWYERFGLLFRSTPSALGEQIKDAHQKMAAWIDLDSNYELTTSIDVNVGAARKAFKPFHDFLSLRDASSEIVIVPDTNALTSKSDPVSYQGIAGVSAFTFLLLPTVISELEKLKVNARDPAHRDKVAKVIRRI